MCVCRDLAGRSFGNHHRRVPMGSPRAQHRRCIVTPHRGGSFEGAWSAFAPWTNGSGFILVRNDFGRLHRLSSIDMYCVGTHHLRGYPLYREFPNYSLFMPILMYSQVHSTQVQYIIVVIHCITAMQKYPKNVHPPILSSFVANGASLHEETQTRPSPGIQSNGPKAEAYISWNPSVRFNQPMYAGPV